LSIFGTSSKVLLISALDRKFKEAKNTIIKTFDLVPKVASSYLAQD
jgi:hypothetical protein